MSKIEDKFNLNSVSLTGDEPENARQSTLYTFEGTDYKKTGKEDPDGLLMTELIDIGSRRDGKQQNYNIDSYYKEKLLTKPKTDNPNAVPHVRR